MKRLMSFVQAIFGKSHRQTAETEDAEAQFALGNAYCTGDGVEQDFEAAVEWFRKAAEQGLAEAQFNLWVCYSGKGAAKNLEEAAKWLRKAAEQGLAKAQLVLGAQCKIEENLEEAAKWYRKAAEQGDAKAQFFFGTCYYNGEGVEEDYEEAVEWFRKAAKQGDAEAQNALKQLDESW